MFRKIALTATAATVAAGALLAAAGAAEAKTGASLTVKPGTVTAGHSATFTVNESSDSQHGANRLQVSLQELVGHHWTTVAKTAKATHHGKDWGDYALGYKATKIGVHTFRAVASYHGKKWGTPSNTVHLTVKKAGKPKPRHALRLASKYATVHSGHADAFTVRASTTAGQATGLKVCLERALPKGPGWETLKCVTVAAKHGNGTAVYQISEKLAHKGARYQFRAVAYSHGKAWAVPSNSVFVSVN